MGRSPVDLLGYPAVHAFLLVCQEHKSSLHISTLKEHSDSMVYCLEGIGPSKIMVVAKQCLRPNAAVEEFAYGSILPQIVVAHPYY